MSWKFKASKYKNTAPIESKLDKQIRELSIGSYHSCGNFIAASATYMGFNWDTLGSSIAILPLTASGRPDKASIPRIDGHSDMVTDFAFSPFDDNLVLTGSQDQTIKLWRIPEKGLYSNLSTPEVVLPEQPRKVETVGFNPAVHGIISSSADASVSVWDAAMGAELFQFSNHDDKVQSVAWQPEGRLLATQCKDRKLRLLDPRSASPLVSETASHNGLKDSKVVWVDDGRILTSGFSEDRCRELILRDTRNLSSPQHVLSLDVSSGILIPLYDPDTNMLFLTGKGDRYIQFAEVQDRTPWFGPGLKYTGEQIKGGCLIPKRAVDVMQCEINRVLVLGNNSIIPVTWQVPRKSYREYHADVFPDVAGTQPGMGPDDWIKGANVPIPKISLNPSKRPESLATSNAPTLSQIPRTIKPSDRPAAATVLMPPPTSAVVPPTTTAAKRDPSPKPTPRPRLSRESSLEGHVPKPAPRTSVSSDSSRPNSVNSSSSQHENGKGDDVTDDAPTGFRRQPSMRDKIKAFELSAAADSAKPKVRIPSFSKPKEITARLEKEMDMTAEDNKENSPMEVEKEAPKVRHQQEEVIMRPKNRKDSNNPFTTSHMRPQLNEPTQQNRASRFGRVTKFRHMKGTPLHKSKHFDNLKNLSKSLPAECEYIQANTDRLAIPLAGPGGKVAIIETAKAGRISDGVMPAVINTGTAMDFAWDPFNNARLAVVTDEGALNLWIIPEGGLFVQVNKPDLTIPAHSDKASLVRFNPVAKDIIATAAFDWLLKIWNLCTDQEVAALTGHTDQIYSMAWSQCGRFLSTVCRDGKVRIYDPRSGNSPVREGGDIVAKKGARIIWALENKFIIVSGFSRQSERQIIIYDSKDLSVLHTETMSVSPGMLIPYYDEDSSTLFLSGKGEVTVNAFEIAEDAPHMFQLSAYKAPNPSQGYGFLPHKNALDIKGVEFARAYRLTTKTIEPISFTVPRVKSAYFQDDLFPPTLVAWEALCSAETWLKGDEPDLRFVSLQPEGMPSLSGNTIKLGSGEGKRKSVEEKNNINNINNLNSLTREETKEVNRDITKAMTDIMESKIEVEEELEQDRMEGVDSRDWENDN